MTEIRPTSVLTRGSAGTEEIPADAVFLLTGYRADSDLMARAGITFNARNAPHHNPETFETNVPNLFVAGGAIAGEDTGTVFIENGRFHGAKIVDVIARRSGSGQRLRCATSGKLHVRRRIRAISTFISSSSTSDSARERRHPLLEERLLLERIEIEILRERVDQIFVGHRRGNRRGSPANRHGPLDGRREQRFELRPLPPDRGSVFAREHAARGAARRARGGSCGSWSSSTIRNRSTPRRTML